MHPRCPPSSVTALPCQLPPGRGKALFVLTQPLPSLRRSPHPALRATCPIPFVPSGHFPLTRGIGPRGRLPSQSRLRRASSPKGGAKVAPSGLCPLPPPVGEVPRRGGEGRPQNTKKALPPWGCQGGRGRRGCGCARGRGQPRLNSGDLWPVFRPRRMPGIFFCVRSGGADHFSSPMACSTASTILPERIMAATLFMSR